MGIVFPYPFDPEPLGTDAWKLGEDLKVIGAITSYTYAQPTDGATVTATVGLAALVLEPAAPLATLTVVLPPTPDDGQVFELSTTQDISALTVDGAAGDSVIGSSVGVLAQNGGASWRYRKSNTTWYRRY